MNKALMIGVNNKAWVPCMYASSSHPRFIKNDNGRLTIANTGGTYPQYWLPLPTVKGTLKLYVDAVRIEIYDADANSYLNAYWAYAIDATTTGTIDTDGTSRTAPGQYDVTFTPYDCSGKSLVTIILECVTSVINDLSIGLVAFRCYYDV